MEKDAGRPLGSRDDSFQMPATASHLDPDAPKAFAHLAQMPDGAGVRQSHSLGVLGAVGVQETEFGAVALWQQDDMARATLPGGVKKEIDVFKAGLFGSSGHSGKGRLAQSTVWQTGFSAQRFL
jgi:hypothetical protein